MVKMVAACSSETLVSVHKTIQWHNPEDHNMNNHCLRNTNICIIAFTAFIIIITTTTTNVLYPISQLQVLQNRIFSYL
jgi:hypothetical protein